MKRTHIGIVALAGLFVLGSSEARAQRSASSGSSEGRSAGDATVVGSAVPRSSGESGVSSPAPSGSIDTTASSPASVGSAVPGGGLFVRTPSAAETLAFAPQRRGGGGQSTGERAVPRGESGGGSGGRTTASAPAPSGGSTSSTAGSRSNGGDRRAVPTYSRPRQDRPVQGYAVDRGSVRPPSGGGSNIIYYPYYPNSSWGYYPYGAYGYGAWGLGYGLGWGLYDPFWSPYGGYGYGGYGSGYGSGYGGGYYGGGSGYESDDRGTGSLRLKVDPREAKVYVDGYFVGEVDEFDGVFQKLGLDAGSHKIELRADGYEAATIDVLITPGETVTYKGELIAIGK